MAARRNVRARFPERVVAAIHTSSYLKVRCGAEHRFTAIWSVVVDGRVFVRSWYMRPGGWYFSFLEQPLGAIQVGARELRVRAKPVRSSRVKTAVSKAYAEKYVTPASIKYVKGFARGKRRDTTTELAPR
ncbi:MAG: DUF2255 family protein [Gemmatimonadota bacterium]